MLIEQRRHGLQHPVLFGWRSKSSRQDNGLTLCYEVGVAQVLRLIEGKMMLKPALPAEPQKLRTKMKLVTGQKLVVKMV